MKCVRVVEEKHCLISFDTRCMLSRECLELFPVRLLSGLLPVSQRNTSLSRASVLAAASLCLAVIVVVVVNCVTILHRTIFLHALCLSLIFFIF